MSDWTVAQALRRGASFLASRGREGRAAEILLGHALGVSRQHLFLRLEEPLDPEVFALFWSAVEAHAAGTPVQHLTRSALFYGRSFVVNRHVLIPRPETEELVAGVLSRRGDETGLSVVDVGCGSGVIAITLMLERPNWNSTAIDISSEALKVAEINAEQLGVQERIAFVHGDLLKPLREQGRRADIIVSNPPYIAEHEKETLDSLVVDHEPSVALFGGKDGLDYYRRILADIPDVVVPGGLVAFEVGAEQSRHVAFLVKKYLGSDIDVEIEKDIRGIERLVFATV